MKAGLSLSFVDHWKWGREVYLHMSFFQNLGGSVVTSTKAVSLLNYWEVNEKIGSWAKKEGMMPKGIQSYSTVLASCYCLSVVVAVLPVVIPALPCSVSPAASLD